MPCLSGRCGEASVGNLATEVAHFAAALPAGHPIHVGVYFSGYSHCDAPSVAYDRGVLAAALALPWVAGATIYITERPQGPASACQPGSSDKGCVVREVFGGWAATPEARAFHAACPAATPFLAQGSATLCCGEAGPVARHPFVVPGGGCAGGPGCCLAPAGCPAGVPACTCPAGRPYTYGSFDGGEFCCASRWGLPTHCTGGGECCLRPGLEHGCQGLRVCNASAAQTPPPPPPPSSVASLVRLGDDRARCLDGSKYAYYISKPAAPSAGFYIFHQGGGWCQNVSECARRALTRLGSSANYSSTLDLAGTETHVLMSRNATRNPLTATWTLVWLPYCDGASFTGDSSAPGAGAAGSALFFRGLAIREAVARSLRTTAGFGAATDVVVGGCSAGATAAYLHLDWWHMQARQLCTRNPSPMAAWRGVAWCGVAWRRVAWRGVAVF